MCPSPCLPSVTRQMLHKYFRMKTVVVRFCIWHVCRGGQGRAWSLRLIAKYRILWPFCFLQNSTDGVMMRTGSLQLSSSSGTLSLKRTKRKAPAPPSKTPPQNDDSSLASDNGILLCTVHWFWLCVLLLSVKQWDTAFWFPPFWTDFHYISVAGLELPNQNRLASDS